MNGTAVVVGGGIGGLAVAGGLTTAAGRSPSWSGPTRSLRSAPGSC
jgi:hypothetical protein